jgi:hypothetical protein
MHYEAVPESDSGQLTTVIVNDNKEKESNNRHCLETYLSRGFITALLIVAIVAVAVILSAKFILPTAQHYLCSPPYAYTTSFKAYPEFQTLARSDDQRWRDLVSPNGGFFYKSVEEERYKFGIAMFY